VVGTNRAPPFPFISEQKATKETKVSQHFDRCSIGWVRLTICRLHPLWNKADELSRTLIGAAIEVHRIKGPGLIESIYERCLLRELELRSIAAKTQKIIRIEYKGLIFDEPLRFDLLVEDCLLVEMKAVEILHPSAKAQLFSYMRLLDVPIGLVINFHEPLLKSGIHRMILPGANLTQGNKGNEVRF
jgi:GxxExxY protein